MDIVGYVLTGIMAAFGLFVFLFPKLATRADKRDDPSEVEKMRKGGLAMIGFAAFAAFLVTKYNLF